jgi:hypothetical protein
LQPSCSQCVRVAAKCPGYRNAIDNMFRDETRLVELKSRCTTALQEITTRKSRARRMKGTLRRTDSTTPFAPCQSLLPRTILPSAREVVIPLFFHYFAVEDTMSGHAILSCLPQTIPTVKNDIDNALSAAILSVGYALLANITNTPDQLVMARREYGVAVRTTCDVIQKCAPSNTCEIVRVILLLALFEVST